MIRFRKVFRNPRHGRKRALTRSSGKKTTGKNLRRSANGRMESLLIVRATRCAGELPKSLDCWRCFSNAITLHPKPRLVTELTIEEKLLATLSAKHDLALAALDMESNVREVALTSGIEELKQRLEVLLGARVDAPVDETERQRHQQEAERLARRSRVAEAGDQLVAAAFAFLGEMIPQRQPTNGAEQKASEFKARLAECLERDEQGRRRLTVTLPNEAALESLASSLAALFTVTET
jgi:hypothetical protein